MIKHLNSDHSITIEGSKEKINDFKKKIAKLLKIEGTIDDNLFIELQSVFKPRLNEQGERYNISKEEAFKRQNKKVEYTDNCKRFLAALGNKDEQQLELPTPPIGNLSFEEVKKKFGFEKDTRPRTYIINVPADLTDTLQVVKKAYQPDEKENRFSIKEDVANPNSINYNFEVVSNDKLKVRRFNTDTDDQHFVYTSLRLLRFYQSQDSGPILNLFKERAASYLINCLNSPTDLPYAKIPEFHCELIEKNYDIPPIELFFKNPVRITIYQASFLIEIFCEIQDKSQKCNFSKTYLSHKDIYFLSILSPLPVAFEYIDSTADVELTFADTSIASADFIFNQVRFAMKIFDKLPQYYSTFFLVDSVYWPSEKFITVHERLGFAIIRGTDKDSTGKAATFPVWAILNKPNDQSQIDAIKREMSEIYDEIKLYMCDQCSQWFSHGFGGECVIYEHMGSRVPFPDGEFQGQMEKIDYVRDDDSGQIIPVKSFYYECCGEKPENAPGCQEMLFPFGHIEKVNEAGQQITCSGFADQFYFPN